MIGKKAQIRKVAENTWQFSIETDGWIVWFAWIGSSWEECRDEFERYRRGELRR